MGNGADDSKSANARPAPTLNTLFTLCLASVYSYNLSESLEDKTEECL